MSHTKGPWSVERERGQYIVTSPSGGEVARIAKWTSAVELDDARLIAAAPDLLEALRKLGNEATGMWAMANPDAHGHTNLSVLRLRIDEALAVIAKAEGR